MKARCFRGGAALAAGSVFERGARFVTNMILARLLAPEQFGLMALVLAANGLLETLTEVGVRQAVVQNKRGDTAEFVNVAWWFSAVRGLVLYLAGLAAAPWIARFYGEPALVPLLRVAFLTMLFNGLTNPHLYVLEKRLEFGRYVWMVQGSALAGTTLTLALTLWVPNVWALVAGFVGTAGLQCAASFIFCPVRFELRFDRQALRELFRFSRGMAGLPIMTYLFMQADIFFLGRMCGKELLGLYAMAMTLASMPQVLFSRVAGPMVLPVLSDSAESKQQLRNRLLRMTRMLFVFGLPMTTCLAVFSGSILMVVYGPKYAQVAGAYGVLGFYVLIYTSGMFVASIYMAVGKPGIHRWFTGMRLILMWFVLYPAIHWFGATGAAGAKVFCMGLAGIVQLINLSRLIGLSVREYLATVTQGAVLSCVILVPAIAIEMAFESAWIQLVAALGMCSAAWGYILWTKRHGIGELMAKKAKVMVAEG